MSGKMDLDFAQFLDSMVSLDTLDRMTRDLDDELKDSQVVMNQIKGMIDALPPKVENVKSEPNDCDLRHEDISNFLAADSPQLLMPDMDENTGDVDFEDIIGKMKRYVEDLKKNLPISQTVTQVKVTPQKIENFDLEQYAVSLDQCCKILSNLRINKRDEIYSRNHDLEAKLSLLCDDVNMFTKMVQAQTTLGETNKNWTAAEQKSSALEYDNLVNKLLSGVNEVSYLLQKKN